MVFTVMPKGVEHEEEVKAEVERQPVVFTVMPKGVEHIAEYRDKFTGLTGGFYCDAERR